MENKTEKMGSDIVAEIVKGRKVGYSDNLIRKSLELEGYSPESIKQAFRETEKRKNGNGNGVIVKTQSIKKQIEGEQKEPNKEHNESPKAKEQKPKKHWLKIIIEILIGIVVFAIIGILMYLFFLPAVVNA